MQWSTEVKAQGYDIPDAARRTSARRRVAGHPEAKARSLSIDAEERLQAIAYHGPLAADGKAYAADAIDSILAGKPVANVPRRSEVRRQRSSLPRARAKAAENTPTSPTPKEIAPILQAKCVTCHQKGGIAPFAMDSYDVVKTFAPMIRESVRSLSACPPTSPIRTSVSSRTTRA
jgi:hypothetical protein